MLEEKTTIPLNAQGLSVSAGSRLLIRNVNLEIPARQVLGIIGPSGAGKSTFLRCLNRMIDFSPGLRVEGIVAFHGKSIRDPSVDADALRARIGMLFQQPVVFPKSIYQNVIFGARHSRQLKRKDWQETVEKVLREVSLWNEVKDRLQEPALRLSVGQQQRLCLARTLALNPEIILMDEPTSALDPKSAGAIEDLIFHLKQNFTIVLVTHNLQQARRVTDCLACFCMLNNAGEILESGASDALFSRPRSHEVAQFLRNCHD